MENGLIAPTAGAVATLQPRRKSKRWEPGPGVTPEQAEAIVGAANTERDRMLFCLLFATGVRVSEALSVRPCDLLDGRTIRYRLEKNRQRSWNDVVLWPEDRELIAELHAYARTKHIANHQPIFSGRGRFGGSLTRQRAGQLFSSAAARAGVLVFDHGTEKPAHPHSARHSRTRWDLARGLSLPAIQRQRGHARLASTEPYLAPDSATIAGAMERL